jgi:predicted RNase H-like HicB family nuclease
LDDDRYRIEVFWSDEDECWIANIPDLRYCSAFGDTPQEALAEVLIAKGGWLDSMREMGSPLPEPSRSPAQIAQHEVST